MAEKKEKKPGKVKKYFKDVKGEMKKVVWPSRKQLVKNTVIVIVCCLVVGIFIALLDLGLGQSLGRMLNKDDKPAETPIVNTEDVNVETEAPAAEGETAPEADAEAPAEEAAPEVEGEANAEAEDAQ